MPAKQQAVNVSGDFMADSTIKYALHKLTGMPVYIDDAQNGLKCNCKCAECGNDMIANQGDVYEHYFDHHNKITNCKGGQETAIHKLAKQIINDNSQILIPGETLFYSQARQEERFGSIIPDVTVFANGQNVYFEIAVTNPVDNIKETFYNNGQHKCIEIDLTNISYDTTTKELEELVLKTAKRRKIFWTLPEIEIYEEKKDNLIHAPITIYQIENDKESWWTNLNPIVILGLIIAVIFLLYKGFKLLTDKNRR